MITITAYLLRWGFTSTDEGGHPVRFTPDSLSAWLDSDPDLPIVVDHGRPAGRWTDFQVDEIGLRVTGRLDDSPFGRATAQRIRSGGVQACSFHGLFGAPDSRAAGAYDVTDLQPVEGGPCSDPADAGAVIVSIDGRHLRDAEPWAESLSFGSFDDVLAHFEALTGISAVDVEAERRAARQNVRDEADAIERLALRLARTRRSAESAWRASRSPWRRASDHDAYRDLDLLAVDLDAELAERLCHDADLIADVYRRYRVPPAVSPMARLRAALAAA